VSDADEVKASTWSRALAWVWEHRRSLAPFVGVAAAIVCPHLGPVAGPCKLVGEVMRSWSFNGTQLP
jgi:hypothetical protein